MSKIGRKPIETGSVKIEINGQEIHFKGSKSSGVYVLPDMFTAELSGSTIKLAPKKSYHGSKNSADINRLWGLHRALLSNQIKGAQADFERQVQIIGLGYKAALAGRKVTFTLGYSHKIDFELPTDVTMVIEDKAGQMLRFKSPNKELLGHVCSMVRALRKPEPYKGTGIKYANEVIARKAGKTKAS